MSLGLNGSSAGANASGWKEIARYDTAGTYTWTCPKTATYGVFVVGGGGGGGRLNATATSSVYCANGGASGFSNTGCFSKVQGNTVSVVVGQGGSGATAEAGTSGGQSNFGNLIASGGGAGSGSSGQKMATGASGNYVQSSYTAGYDSGYGFYSYLSNNSYDTRYFASKPWLCINPFTMEQCLGAGGSVNTNGGTLYRRSAGKNPITGLGGGGPSTAFNTSGEDATEFGCGGGACWGTSSSVRGGNGADGIVIIYEKLE